MKGMTIAGLVLLLLAACGGGNSPHPEVLAAFNDYRHEMGLEMTDEQAACFAGINQDVLGRKESIRAFREPREWNMEMATSDNWEQIRARLETAGERIVAECGFETM